MAIFRGDGTPQPSTLVYDQADLDAAVAAAEAAAGNVDPQVIDGQWLVGNDATLGDTESLALMGKGTYDDFSGVSSGTQSATILEVTGTPLSATGKLIANASAVIGRNMDAGTAPHVYWASYEAAGIIDFGAAYTLPELRSFEADPTFHSGTVSEYTGFNSRFHVGSPANSTISSYTAFRVHGPKGGFPSTTFGEFAGFLQRFDQDNALNATFTDMYGILLDNPDKIDPLATLAYTNAYGIWLNGYGAGSDILLGDNKEFRISTATGGGEVTQCRIDFSSDSPGFNREAWVCQATVTGDGGSNTYAGFNGLAKADSITVDGTGLCTIAGGLGAAWMNGGGARTMPLGVGVDSYCISTAGTLTNGVSLRAAASIAAGGVITNATGLEVRKQTVGSTSNQGIHMNGSNIGCDIAFGAGKQVRVWWNGTNLEFNGTGIAFTGSGDVAINGSVSININGTVRKFATVA